MTCLLVRLFVKQMLRVRIGVCVFWVSLPNTHTNPVHTMSLSAMGDTVSIWTADAFQVVGTVLHTTQERTAPLCSVVHACITTRNLYHGYRSRCNTGSTVGRTIN